MFLSFQPYLTLVGRGGKMEENNNAVKSFQAENFISLIA